MDFFTSDETLIQQISETLTQCGCCARCTLRYLGLTDMYTYRGDTKEMNALVKKLEEKKAFKDENKSLKSGEENDQPENEKGTEDTETTDSQSEVKKNKCERDEAVKEQCVSCIVCLGILDEFTSETFLNKIKNEVTENGFEFSTYMCSLKIPVCMILREHALMLYLKEKHEDVYGDKRYTDVATVKDVWKWRNGPILKNVLGAPFDMKSPFDITLTFQYKDSDQECAFLLTSDSDTFRKRKQDKRCKKRSAFALYNRANVAKAVDNMPETEFKRNYQCPPKAPACPTVCDMKCQNEVLFIAGRYNKYSRFLSQTPWVIEGVRKCQTSVEELLCMEIKKHFKQSEEKFSSSGREDVDVLMLGNGRPFVLELINPRRREFTQKQITEMQELTNAATSDIQCRDLQIVSREETENLKEGEIDKVKLYRALCWSKQPLPATQLHKLANLKELKILQKTPVRVLHRRPLATRDKMIHSMSVEKVDEHHFRVGLSTQAGTYIKEFVHGDFGRTKPNFFTILGVECDILELDVMAVELDWPKKIEVT